MTLPLSYSRNAAQRRRRQSDLKPEGGERAALPGEDLELMMGLEPMTSPLPRECSTTELHQRTLHNKLHYPIANAPFRGEYGR